MAGHGSLLKLFTSINNYKSTLLNRVTVSVFQQQDAGIKQDTKDKLKTLKIPEAPKKPMTPFFQYLYDQRSLIQKEHPDWKLPQISKQCSEDWKKTSETIKQKYQQAYHTQLEEFNKRSTVFAASLTEEQKSALKEAKAEKRADKKKRSLKKLFRQTGKPKRPATAYVFFIKEKSQLPENKGKPLHTFLPQLSQQWKSLSDNEKQKYVGLQTTDASRYKTEMNKWEAKMIKEGNVDVVRKENKLIVERSKHHQPKTSKHC